MTNQTISTEEVYAVIRELGYTTSRQSQELAEAVDHPAPQVNDGWIRVEDRLPEGRVLVRSRYVGSVVASRTIPNDNPDAWTWGVINNIDLPQEDVTHWMPLPNPPQVKE